MTTPIHDDTAYAEDQRAKQIDALGDVNKTLQRIMGFLILLVLLSAYQAAEAHDANCYTRATFVALGSLGEDRPDDPACTVILPWNEPD